MKIIGLDVCKLFEKALGVAPTEDSSGDMTSKKIVGGSDLCRIALWQWIFTRLEIKRCRPKSKIGQYLGQVTDREKATGKHIRIVRMRIAAYTVRLLFNELTIAVNIDRKEVNARTYL